MNITLTQEQIAMIAKDASKSVALEKKAHEKAYAALQRRTDARVESANQRAKEWKERYSMTRKNLLAAYAEIAELKRRLRDRE